MRVCHIVPSLEEQDGGPSKSVKALAGALAAGGLQVDLLSTGPAPVAGAKVFPRTWPEMLKRSPGLAGHLSGEHYDCIHNHALWLLPLRYAHSAARRHGVPLVISPRGMMTEWAWSHHRLRKRLARLLVHPGALEGAAGWHATSAAEAGDIRRLGFRQPVCVAPNGVTVPTLDALQDARRHWAVDWPDAEGRPVALFYSRFHRKKRVRELIDLWTGSPRGDWLLLLAGIPEEYSVGEVTGWIPHDWKDRVRICDSRGRPPPYALASLFLLPSLSENFGMVVAEALASGVPVLTTDATPWESIAGREAGWCVPWKDFAPTLDTALRLPAADLGLMGKNGRQWMEQEFTWAATAHALEEFYRSLNRD